jgi:hypothetical protein
MPLYIRRRPFERIRFQPIVNPRRNATRHRKLAHCVDQVEAMIASLRYNARVALDRAGMTVFRDITFLAAGPASERSRSAARRLALCV